jgi:hypothetical protein
MNTRFFLLLESLQRLDDRLRLARSRLHADPLEIARLHARKVFMRGRLSRLALRSFAYPV